MKPSRSATVLALASAAAVVALLGQLASAVESRPPAAAAPRPGISVALTRPAVETWPQTLYATGAVAAWQEAVIAAEVGGLRISEVRADVGSRVKRGDVLAVLADDTTRADLQKQQATVAQARANLAQAQANVRRAEGTESSGAISAQQIDTYRATEATSQATLEGAEADLRTTQIHLAQTRIVAVDDGIVSSRSALLGNVVASGTELFRLVRQGRVDWQAELDAQQLAHVAVGQAAQVTLPSGQVVHGRVRLLAPTVSTSTGRAIVYVALDRDSGAVPGVFASGQIEGPPTPAMTLPQSAVVLRDGRSDVFVLTAQSSASRRTVATGRRRGDRVEIVSGLPADAQVIAGGGAFLAEGMAVQAIAASSAQAQAPASLAQARP